MANIPLKSIKFPDLADTYTVPSNAGELAYNKSATYPADTVGKALQNIGDSSAPAIIETATGSIASFTDGANVPVKDLVAEIVPLQSGSGDPSPSNVRAISGWTEANVCVRGKNFFDGSTVTTTATSNWGVTWADDKLVIEHKNGYITGVPATPYMALPSGTYCFSYDTSVVRVVDIYINNAFSKSINSGETFTLSDGDTVAIKFVSNSAETFTFSNVQLERNSTATTYEPYNGETHTISFASAGTVYGGSIDVTSGVLTVDRAMADLGEFNYIYVSASGSERFVTSGLAANIKKPPNNTTTTTAICSNYKPIAVSSFNSDNKVFGVYADGDVLVRDTTYSDKDTFKSAMDGVKLCYPLATPQTYQLTPTEVKTLLGNNNVWADTGDVTVEYVADTKTFIENLVNA